MQPQPPAPPPPQGADEPRAHYAARLFCAILDDANRLYAMPDDLIELAAYGARTATDARQMPPQYYARIADAERLIAGAIRRRAFLALEQSAPAVLDGLIQAPPPGRPNGPAVPVRPYPTTQPPAGTTADNVPFQPVRQQTGRELLEAHDHNLAARRAALDAPAERGTRTRGGTLIRF
jgi:hypothetical protein